MLGRLSDPNSGNQCLSLLVVQGSVLFSADPGADCPVSTVGDQVPSQPFVNCFIHIIEVPRL